MTIDLPDDLPHRIADAIRDSLVSSRETTIEAPPLVISRSASGLPFIKALPGAHKPAVTADEIHRLIEESQLEEDLQRAGISR